MTLFLFWIALSFVAGAIAGNKGRSAIGFFFLAVFLSPLIGIIAAVVAKPNQKNLEDRQLRSGTMKRCPYCAEIVKAEATRCRYCEKDFPHANTVAGSTPGPSPEPRAPVVLPQPPPMTDITAAARYYGVSTAGERIADEPATRQTDSRPPLTATPPTFKKPTRRLNAIVLIFLALIVVAWGVVVLQRLWSQNASPSATPQQSRGSEPDSVPRLASAALTTFGSPDVDDSTENDLPRPLMVTRMLTYRRARVRLIYVPDAPSAAAAPPYKDWVFVEATDPLSNTALTAEEAIRRLVAYRTAQGNGVPFHPLNRLNAELLDLSEQRRGARLRDIVVSEHHPCLPVRTFYRGITSEGDASWALACRDQTTYLINIHGDEKGSVTVMSCDEFRKMSGSECFAKF